MKAKNNAEHLLNCISENIQKYIANEEYLRGKNEHLGNMEARNKAFEIIRWRNLAEEAIKTAESHGADTEGLRSFQADLLEWRTEEQWRELEKYLPKQKHY
jgi:hypothetical protein